MESSLPGRFRGQRILITGASTGIGRATAVAFVAEGASVIAVARSGERLQELARELGGRPNLIPITADVTDPDSMEAMASRALSEGRVPDVVVANAGIGLDALFVETSEEALRAVFDVNVLGVVRTVRPFIAGMVERGSGRILLVSSVAGKRGIPHYAAYSASKFALHGMADALRPELRGTGVSLGIICPSSTRTEFHDRKLRQGPSQKRTRPGQHSAESVARAILKMASSRRRELVLTPEGKLLSWTNVLAPRLLDRILGRILVRKGSP